MDNYYISLDIGVSSIGWSVFDDNNKLLKLKKKNMWGVRLFDSAQTASERRLARQSRRRYSKRKKRIRLLQELIGNEVLEIDPNFFFKLNETDLIKEEKTKSKKNNLFDSMEYSDKDYFKEYPTIYHLRNDLMESNSKKDFRLIYLALHHIVKYRGNFLYEGQDFSNIEGNIEVNLHKIENLLNDFHGLEFQFPTNFIDILKDTKISRNDKRILLIKQTINISKDLKNILDEVYKAILGLKFNPNILFKLLEQSVLEKLYISDLEEKMKDFEDVLGDKIDLITEIQLIYNWFLLQEILQGEKTISKAQINKYNKHKNDLRLLKELFSKEPFSYETYKKFSNEIYEKYINNVKDFTKKQLYDELKRIITPHKDNIPSIEKILEEIENETLLPKQNEKINGAIIYQLHEKEMIQIISKQARYYPILDKYQKELCSLVNFRVPYYIGPLTSNEKSPFAWMVRKNNNKITPWNIRDNVDFNLSAENFIKRMLNYCEYLPLEPVLPKNSLLYSEYCLLNEINRIRVNKKLLTTEQKKQIIEELFADTKKTKITKKDLKNWLINNWTIPVEDYQIEGLAEEYFLSNLKSLNDFKAIFGYVDSTNRQMIEEIIYWLTLFNDKQILKDKIKESYPHIDEEQVSKILKLNYKDWGRLSKRLLNGLKAENGQTIMDILRNSNQVFMQIINEDNYGFNSMIKEIQEELNNSYSLEEQINKLPGSPALKKAIKQSCKIIEEIISIKKYKPKRIYVEVPREDQASKKTSNRYNKIKKLIEDSSLESNPNMKSRKELLKELKENEKKLDNERVYLYFLQLGRCMYSKENLSIEELSNYEIDHIIPRSLIVDNSIDNKVLVLKKYNQLKGADLLPLEMIKNKEEIKKFWKILYDLKYISDKKFNNLNLEKLTEYKITAFINRQLVETRQITKNFVALMDRYFDIEISLIKAQLVSNLRESYGLHKNRLLNDYHHAHDSYLTGILGNYILKRYPKLTKEIIYKEYLVYKSQNNDKRKNRFGFIINSLKNKYVNEDGEIIWRGNECLEEIRKVLNYKDCFITKKVEEQKGELFNITLLKKNKGTVYAKKSRSIEYYGGYNSIKAAYFAIFSYKSKNKINLDLIAIPRMYEKSFKNSKENLINYIKEKSKKKDIVIVKDFVPKYQLINSKENGLVYIVSDGEIHNARQLLLNSKYNSLLRDIEKNKRSKDEEQDSILTVELFNEFIGKTDTLFPCFTTLNKKLNNEKAKENFKKLNIEDRKKVIGELLKITQTNASNGNLKLIGLSDREGRLEIKVKLNQSQLIYQSITGMFEKRVDLSELADSCYKRALQASI